MNITWITPGAILVLLFGTMIAGCGGHIYKEEFKVDDQFRRIYQTPHAIVCEAARQTLLGQGYVLGVC